MILIMSSPGSPYGVEGPCLGQPGKAISVDFPGCLCIVCFRADRPPCTRNGFLASLEEIIPEWLVPDRDRKVKMKDGAELHEVVDGKDKLVAVYNEDTGRFERVKTEGGKLE